MEVKIGYKQTEVGVIPEDWRMERLDAVCDVRDGTHESPRFFDAGVPFVTSKNIVEGRLDLENVSYISKADAVEFDKRSKVDRNDILMSMIGTIGSAVLIDFEPTFCIKNVALLKPRKVAPPYLIQLINSPTFQRYLGENLDGGIQKFISLGTLRQLAIPVPDDPEQRAIAAALSDVDGLLGGLDRLIAKKRDLKQAAMQQLLTGQTRLPGFHGEWEVKTVSQIALKIIDYRGRTPLKLGMDWGGGDIPALSARNVKMGYIDFEEEAYFASEALYKRWMTNGDAKKGDLLMTTEAPLGNVALIPDDRKYILSQRTILLQVNPEIALSHYLLQAMSGSAFQRLLSDNSSGSTATGIQRKRLEKLELLLPSVPEQTAIAEVLSEMDGELAVLEQRREKTRALKQAMMQQLLTGRTRLV